MDCSQCCEDPLNASEMDDSPPEESVIHPFGDHVMEHDEDVPELAEGAVPPPPDMPEDLDGNWVRPQRD